MGLENGCKLLLYPFISVEIRSHVEMTVVEQILEFQEFGYSVDLGYHWALS
jgi:hypothetical protein